MCIMSIKRDNWLLLLSSDTHKTGTQLYLQLTLKVLVTTIDALGHFKLDNYSTVGGDGGCRVGEVRAGTTSPMPDHKGFKLQ